MYSFTLSTVCSFSRGGICKEGREERLIHTKISRVFLFVPIPLCSPEFKRCSQRTSGSQGADDVVCAGLDERGKSYLSKMLE